MRLPTRKSEILARTKQSNDAYLTQDAIERMKAELVRLVSERPALAEEVRRTGAMGDLSENAAYQVAKASLRRLNTRITVLEENIKNAIPIQKSSDGVVAIGSTVVLENEKGRVTFDILGSSETNPLRGRISHASPLGAALIGHAAGDEVTAAGITYRIVEVR